MDYFEKYGKSLAEGRDLNPRTLTTSTVFKTAALSRSATLPLMPLVKRSQVLNVIKRSGPWVKWKQRRLPAANRLVFPFLPLRFP